MRNRALLSATNSDSKRVFSTSIILVSFFIPAPFTITLFLFVGFMLLPATVEIDYRPDQVHTIFVKIDYDFRQRPTTIIVEVCVKIDYDYRQRPTAIMVEVCYARSPSSASCSPPLQRLQPQPRPAQLLPLPSTPATAASPPGPGSEAAREKTQRCDLNFAIRFPKPLYSRRKGVRDEHEYDSVYGDYDVTRKTAVGNKSAISSSRECFLFFCWLPRTRNSMSMRQGKVIKHSV